MKINAHFSGINSQEGVADLWGGCLTKYLNTCSGIFPRSTVILPTHSQRSQVSSCSDVPEVSHSISGTVAAHSQELAPSSSLSCTDGSLC